MDSQEKRAKCRASGAGEGEGVLETLYLPLDFSGSILNLLSATLDILAGPGYGVATRDGAQRAQRNQHHQKRQQFLCHDSSPRQKKYAARSWDRRPLKFAC
jgi:hypothetical protein